MYDGTEFFKIVVSGPDGEYRIPRCVRLNELCASAWEYLDEYLVNGVDLQELVVRGYIDTYEIKPREIVKTIRHNGSLLSVTMEHHFECEDEEDIDRRAIPTTIFDEAESRMIRAYCQRNQQLLFSKPFTTSSSSTASVSASSLSSSSNIPHGANHVKPEMMPCCVIPTYFYVLCDAHRMAPTAIFQILLAAADTTSLGASGHVKRKL